MATSLRPLPRALALVAALLLAGCSAAAGTTTPPSPPTSPSPSASPSPSPSTASPTTSAPSADGLPMYAGRVHVVGLGDSVTAASNCGCTDFITQLAARLPAAIGAPGAADNLGRGGLTTAGLHDQVAAAGPARTALSHAGIVVVTIGANDLNPLVGTWENQGCSSAGCIRPAVAAMGRGLTADLALIRAVAPAGARILVTDYWAVFQDGQVARSLFGGAFPPWQDEVTRQANAAICSAARGIDATCVDLFAPFRGAAGDQDDTQLLADDGNHPNTAGEAAIVRALLAALP